MRKYLVGCATILLCALSACSVDNRPAPANQVNNTSEQNALPRVAIAGLAIESSTFSPARSQVEAFRAKTGEQIFTQYPFYAAENPMMQRAEFIPTLTGKAIPGGMVTRDAYETLVGQTLDLLKANLPYDGVFLDMHGAMSVEGLDDPEGDYIKRVREVVGDDALISTSTDLHGNVSWRFIAESDLFTSYRMAPHEDSLISKQRAILNLLDRLETGKGRPAYKAWIPVPILLPGEKTSTRVEPAKSLYAKIPGVEAQPGVVDAAILMGYPWADEPRNHGVVVVVGDDKAQVTKGAEHLAESFWNVRNKFEFVGPVATLDESLAAALASDERPFIISDSGDNPTAGGAGDVTWTLTELLKRDEFKNPGGKSVIYASIPGPEFVKKALEIGVGGMIDAEAGARIDNRYAPPVRIKGQILSIVDTDPDAQVEVVVQVGSVKVIVTKRRKPYHYEKDFIRNGLDPHNTDIVMVKIGYLVPELYNMRKGWLIALTPGGVDQDLERLDYKRLNRPIFPLDKAMADPDLSARLVPLSDQH